jgi:hypothetical protein
MSHNPNPPSPVFGYNSSLSGCMLDQIRYTLFYTSVWATDVFSDFYPTLQTIQKADNVRDFVGVN